MSQSSVFAYNAIFYEFYLNGFAWKGLDFYKEMRKCGVLPDHGLVFKVG